MHVVDQPATTVRAHHVDRHYLIAIRALQLHARIAEVPVRYRKRVGRSKISGTVSGVIKAGFWIVYTIVKYARR